MRPRLQVGSFRVEHRLDRGANALERARGTLAQVPSELPVHVTAIAGEWRGILAGSDPEHALLTRHRPPVIWSAVILSRLDEAPGTRATPSARRSATLWVWPKPEW
ncbi:MAG: hypothetical protein AAGA48_39070 [Myxococcota bacterium]